MRSDDLSELKDRFWASIQESPHGAIIEAASAWDHAMRGRASEAALHVQAAEAGARLLGRRDRHVVSILTLAAQRDISRAAGLAAEHLDEFPDDPIIRYVARRVATSAHDAPSALTVQNTPASAH